MFRIDGLSQPAFGAHKPNEDRWDFAVSPRCIVAAVADGVTQSPRAGEQYPRKLSWKAAHLATRYVKQALRGRRPGPHDEQTLRDAVAQANQRIRQLNQRIGRWECVTDRISTTLLVAWLRGAQGGAEGYVASIGDPIGLAVPPSGAAELLTSDQLAECHRYAYAHFVPDDGELEEDVRRRRHTWQRGYARNNPDAVRPDNPEVHVGYGVLDGDPHALHFLFVRRVRLLRGTHLVLASDALRALRPSDVTVEETESDYRAIVTSIQMGVTARIPAAIVEGIRAAEQRRGMRSDDATVVIIDVG